MPDYRLRRLKGRWVAVWYENGRRHRWRIVAKNAADARAAFIAFTRERDALRRPGEQLTVGDLWHAYVSEKEAQGKVSVTRMRDAWKALCPTFDRLRPADVTAGLVRDYTDLRRRDVSDGTIHTELGYLRAALKHAADEGVITRCPKIILPSKPRPRERHLSADEARRLIDACAMPHVRLFVKLALRTAGRPSSLLDLSWKRVDFKNGRIALDNPERDRTAKGRATVPLAEAIRDDLRKAHAMALTEWVIEWNGKQVGSVKKAVARAVARAGLKDVTPYVLRHTAAVWMAEAGTPMSEISQYLGHTSTAVTERVYARYSPEHLRKASDAIEQRMKDTGVTGCAEPVAVNKRSTKRAKTVTGG